MGAPFPSPRRPAPRRPGRLQRILAALSLRRVDRVVEDRTGTWSPGDMAECIAVGVWMTANGETRSDPERGWTGLVSDVHLALDFFGRHRVFLRFQRWPDSIFDARSFRKLTPRADAATAADADFLQQLKEGAVPSAPPPSIAARLKRILS